MSAAAEDPWEYEVRFGRHGALFGVLYDDYGEESDADSIPPGDSGIPDWGDDQ